MDYQNKNKEELIQEILKLNQKLEQEEIIDAERRRIVKELKNSKEQFNIIFEYASDSYFLLDLKGNFIDINHTLGDIIGYKKEDIIDKNIFDLSIIPQEENSKLYAFLNASALGHTTGPVELMIIDKTGKKVYLEQRTFPVEINEQTMILGIGRDISYKKRVEADLKDSYTKLHNIFEETIKALATTIENRDPYISGHQYRVAKLASAIGEHMNLSEEQLVSIRMSAMLHDIGKITIPSDILNKPGQLNELGLCFIKHHPQVGYEILKGIQFPWPIAQIVLQHHERLDGSGYPSGIKGDDLLMEAKILGVADVVEAMSSHRPYRPSLGVHMALEEIEKNKDIIYDRKVVDSCLHLFHTGKFSIDVSDNLWNIKDLSKRCMF